jgi:alpha-D-ribose 1-methylphosphonate 5-triphosphate synthase subunit PhnG
MGRKGPDESVPEGEAATWTVVRQLSESPEHLGHAAVAGSVLALCERVGELTRVVDRRAAEIGAVLHGLLKQSRATHQLRTELAAAADQENSA